MVVSQSGTEPVTPAVKVQSLNHWTTGEVPQGLLTMAPLLLLFPILKTMKFLLPCVPYPVNYQEFLFRSCVCI